MGNLPRILLLLNEEFFVNDSGTLNILFHVIITFSFPQDAVVIMMSLLLVTHSTVGLLLISHHQDLIMEASTPEYS